MIRAARSTVVTLVLAFYALCVVEQAWLRVFG